MSTFNFRFHGKTLKFETDEKKSKIQVETRPGGWMIATQFDEAGTFVKRVRFQSHFSRQKVSLRTSAGLWSGELNEQTRASSAGGGGSGNADLTAQFPGKVRKILVTVSAVELLVEEGTPLLLLEAMKMEFAVKAPCRGVLKKVLVKEGDQLSPGTLLVDFEPRS